MPIRYSLIIILFVTVFFTNHNSFSYHILNSPSGNSFVFDFLPSMPVDFVVDGGTLGGGNGLPIVQDACDEWNGLPNIGDFCGNLVQSGTDITSANFGTEISLSDGINDIVFDEDGSILAGLGAAGALGIGLTATNSSGAITDILIIVNGSITSSPFADLQATLIHEMGHTWGLAHTPIGGINTVSGTAGLDPIAPIAIPTMYPFNIPSNDEFGRTLEIDDLASALLLYGP